MGSLPPNKVLNASVQKRDFIPEKLFVDVLAENEAEQPLTEVEKSELASLYLDKYVKNDPVFQQDFDQTEKLQYLTDFNKKYQVGQLKAPGAGPLSDLNKGLAAVNLFAGSVADPGWDALSFGMLDSKNDAEARARQEFSGIETDPGFLGDAYRFHQNPYANAVGSFLGAGRQVAGSIGNYAAKGLSPLLSNVLGAGTYSGLSNISNVIQDKMTPIEGITNTVFDAATAPIAGKSRLGNTTIQGALGYAGGLGSSLLSDVSRGQPIDWERAFEQAKMQGVLGAGAGSAFAGPPGKPPRKERPRFFPDGQAQQAKGKTYYSAVPKDVQGKTGGVIPVDLSNRPKAKPTVAGPKKLTANPDIQPDTIKIAQSRKTALNEIDSQQSVDEKTTLQAKARAAKRLYELSTKIQTGRQGTDTPRQQAQRQKTSKELLEKYQAVQRELEAKYPSGKPKIEPKKTSSKVKDRLVEIGVEYREGKRSGVGNVGTKERDLQFKKFLEKQGVSREDRAEIQAKVSDAINKKKAKAQADATKQAEESKQGKKAYADKKAEKARQDRELRAEEARKQKEEEAKEKVKKKKELETAKAEEKARLEASKARLEAAKAEKKANDEAIKAVKKAQAEAAKAEAKANAENAKAEAKAQAKEAKAKLEAAKAKAREQAEASKREAKARAEAEKAEARAKAEELKASAKTQKPPQELPKVLDDAEIEAKSSEMLKAQQENRKGTLDAEIAKLRQQAKKDYTKDGATKSRSDALNSTAKRTLDRYYQKKAEIDAIKAQKTNPVAITKSKKENLRELEAINTKGGEYIPGKATGKQTKPDSSLYTLEDIQDYLNAQHAEASPHIIDWAKKWDEAAKADAEVVIRYDAERSGDTGEFEFKQVAPRGFGLLEGEDGVYRVVGYATNKNLHDGTYYIEPSPDSKKTGVPSQIIEPPILLAETKGKAARGLEPNVYKGQREFSVNAILNRPARINQGPTSQTRAKVKEAKAIIEKAAKLSPDNRVDAKEANDAVKTVKQATQKMKAGKKVDIKKEIVEPAKKMTDKQIVESLKEEAQEMSYGRWLKVNNKRDDSFLEAVTTSRMPRKPSKNQLKAQNQKYDRLLAEGKANKAEYNRLVTEGKIIDPNAKRAFKEVNPKGMPFEKYKAAVLEGKNPDHSSYEAAERLAQKRWAKANPDTKMSDIEMVSTKKPEEQSQRVKDAYYSALSSSKSRTGKAGLTKDQRNYIQAVLEEKVPAKIFRDYAKSPLSGQEMSVIKNAFDAKNPEYRTSLDGLKTLRSESDSTVRTAANKLIEKGLLQKLKAGGSNRYSLTEKGRKIAQEGLKFSSESNTIKIEVPGTKTVYEIPATLEAVLRFSDKTGIKLHQTPSQKVHQELTGDPC